MAPLHRGAAAAAGGSQVLQHFSHPKHPLQEVYTDNEFICDGCNALGYGKRYHCATCDFDLHPRCATCPLTLTFQAHPQHRLSLVNQGGNGRFCDLCGDLVNGLFYTCPACDFDVHPLCTQFPFSLQHAHHPQHFLTLQPANPSWCALCRASCTAWRYRCSLCSIDVHLECALAAQASPQGGGSYAQSPGFSGGGSYGQYSPHGGGSAAGYGVNQQPVQAGMAVNGGRRRKIYSLVGKFAVNAVVSSMLGFPIGFS